MLVFGPALETLELRTSLLLEELNAHSQMISLKSVFIQSLKSYIVEDSDAEQS